MTSATLFIALVTGVCGLTFIIGLYELVTGRMPGNPVEHNLWGYRWLASPARIRLASSAGLLAVVGFVLLAKPFMLMDLIGGGIGVLLGFLVTLSDARGLLKETTTSK